MGGEIGIYVSGIILDVGIASLIQWIRCLVQYSIDILKCGTNVLGCITTCRTYVGCLQGEGNPSILCNGLSVNRGTGVVCQFCLQNKFRSPDIDVIIVRLTAKVIASIV